MEAQRSLEAQLTIPDAAVRSPCSHRPSSAPRRLMRRHIDGPVDEPACSGSVTSPSSPVRTSCTRGSPPGRHRSGHLVPQLTTDHVVGRAAVQSGIRIGTSLLGSTSRPFAALLNLTLASVDVVGSDAVLCRRGKRLDHLGANWLGNHRMRRKPLSTTVAVSPTRHPPSTQRTVVRSIQRSPPISSGDGHLPLSRREGREEAPSRQSMGRIRTSQSWLANGDPALVEGDDMGGHAVERGAAWHGQAIDTLSAAPSTARNWRAARGQTKPSGATAMWSATVPAPSSAATRSATGSMRPTSHWCGSATQIASAPGRQVAGVAAQRDFCGDFSLSRG